MPNAADTYPCPTCGADRPTGRGPCPTCGRVDSHGPGIHLFTALPGGSHVEQVPLAIKLIVPFIVLWIVVTAFLLFRYG